MLPFSFSSLIPQFHFFKNYAKLKHSAITCNLNHGYQNELKTNTKILSKQFNSMMKYKNCLNGFDTSLKIFASLYCSCAPTISPHIQFPQKTLLKIISNSTSQFHRRKLLDFLIATLSSYFKLKVKIKIYNLFRLGHQLPVHCGIRILWTNVTS